MGTKIHNNEKTEKRRKEKKWEKPGERLQKLRKQHYKTQDQFAEALNVSLDAVRSWEQGYQPPETTNLFKIVEKLDCDLDYLTGRIDHTTHGIKFIHDITGLSEKAIRKLQDLPPDQATIVSKIIEHDGFPRLIKQTNALCDKETINSGYALLIIDHVRKGLQDQKTFPVDNGNMVEQAMLFTLSNIFSSIICDITETEL